MPREIRGAHFLIRSAQLKRGTLTTNSGVTKKSNEQTNGSEFQNCERLMRIIIIIIRFDLEEGMI